MRPTEQPAHPPHSAFTHLQEHHMADLFDNPMGLMGFEFVEFAAPVAGTLEPVFEFVVVRAVHVKAVCRHVSLPSFCCSGCSCSAGLAACCGLRVKSV